MRYLLTLSIVLLLAVWLGVQLQNDPGYLLLAYQQWTLEMPLWLGGLLLIISFGIGYLLVRLIAQTSHLGQRWRAFWLSRKVRKARNLTTQGLLELIVGNFAVAEKDLMRAVPQSDAPLLNYLLAAAAANQRLETAQRDHYLNLALRIMPEAKLEIHLAKAQLQLLAGQVEEALAILLRLHQDHPKHPQVLRLIQETYQRLGNWQACYPLLPNLRRYAHYEVSMLKIIEKTCYVGMLKHYCQLQQPKLLTQFWHNLAKTWRQEGELVIHYCQALLQYQLFEEAFTLIQTTLKQQWHERLAYYYGLIQYPDTHKQLAIAEAWLKQQPQSAMLLLSLGRICFAQQLWGKARSYLETSLALSPLAETYGELGKLMAQLEDKEASCYYYQQGLQLALAQPLLAETVSKQ